MANVLVDTDIFVDHLRGRSAFDAGRDRVFYSVVTRAELFAGRGSEEEVVGRLLSSFLEIPLEREIAERAGRLRRTTGIGLADAVIAATAQAGRLTVVTRNRRDFDRVPTLRIRTP